MTGLDAFLTFVGLMIAAGIAGLVGANNSESIPLACSNVERARRSRHADIAWRATEILIVAALIFLVMAIVMGLTPVGVVS